MDVALLSGVVRNRKVSHMVSRPSESAVEGNGSVASSSALVKILNYFSGSAFMQNFTLRVHKFSFKWDLFFHLSVCIFSLGPFGYTGNQAYTVLPLSVWGFYNVLFLIGSRRANFLVPGFSRFKHSFTASIEEFFSPKQESVPLIPGEIIPASLDRSGCGYRNGKELLAYYTIAQTSYLLFMSVIIAMAVCMAWQVADDELAERQTAEEWLKREDPMAFRLRDDIMKKLGSPASAIRPEGNAIWVVFGIVAAVTFTLLGWHNWYLLPPSHTATLLIVLNLSTILTSTLILHLGFFGRLLALYKRNFLRVQCLSRYLETIEDDQLDAWWNCRNFVLNDDLALDYDIAGLAVSATFVLAISVSVVLIMQTWEEGFPAMIEAPGSYCAYACLYITMCLVKIFTIATSTFEEQHRHVQSLQNLTIDLMRSSASTAVFGDVGRSGGEMYYNEFAYGNDFTDSGADYEYDYPADREPPPRALPSLTPKSLGSVSHDSHASGAGGSSSNNSNSININTNSLGGGAGVDRVLGSASHGMETIPIDPANLASSSQASLSLGTQQAPLSSSSSASTSRPSYFSAGGMQGVIKSLSSALLTPASAGLALLSAPSGPTPNNTGPTGHGVSHVGGQSSSGSGSSAVALGLSGSTSLGSGTGGAVAGGASLYGESGGGGGGGGGQSLGRGSATETAAGSGAGFGSSSSGTALAALSINTAVWVFH